MMIGDRRAGYAPNLLASCYAACLVAAISAGRQNNHASKIEGVNA